LRCAPDAGLGYHPDAVQASLKLKSAELFDPGMSRPMKEWVVVPASHATRWQGLADDARAYVATIAAKAKRKPPRRSDSERATRTGIRQAEHPPAT
jgi:hypothetical protein